MGQIRRDLPNDEYQAAVGANNPSASNVFATINDLTSADIPHAVASGTNTYTATIPGVLSYVDGDAYLIRFTNGSDADSTININGLGAKTLTKQPGIQVTGGDIIAGQEMVLIYDGTNFQCIGVAPNQLFAYVTNDEAITITKGQPVYAFGATGNRMSVKLAFNTSDATSAQTVGVVYSSSIAANQRGFIIVQGVIGGLDTSMYAPGDQLYLGATAGSLTNVKPYAPNHLVYIGIVERANAGNGQIYIRTQNGYELEELHDVDLITSAPTDNQVLTFEFSTGLWKNKDQVGAFGKFGIADSLGQYTYYTDLTTAMTAAVSGETIEFFTDYNESGAVSVTLKNGVNINMNGHTYTLSHSAAAVNAFTGSNVQMSFLNGNIVIDTATFSSIGLSVSGSNTDIDCTGLYIKVVSSGGTGRPLAASGGVVRNLRALSIDDLCASASRTTLFNCNLRATGTGNGLSLGLSTLGNVGNAYDCYIQSNSGAGAVVNVNSLCVNCNIVSTSGIGLSLLGGTIRGGSILTGANYAVSSNTEYSSGLHTGTAISNATIISTSTAVLMTAISTANNLLRNCVISGGTNAVEISGTSLASNNYILSCTLSGAAGSNCIYSATLNTPCAYANNVYQTTTTPVSANITADIVNTQDNQGNILV